MMLQFPEMNIDSGASKQGQRSQTTWSGNTVEGEDSTMNNGNKFEGSEAAMNTMLDHDRTYKDNRTIGPRTSMNNGDIIRVTDGPTESSG